MTYVNSRRSGVNTSSEVTTKSASTAQNAVAARRSSTSASTRRKSSSTASSAATRAHTEKTMSNSRSQSSFNEKLRRKFQDLAFCLAEIEELSNISLVVMLPFSRQEVLDGEHRIHPSYVSALSSQSERMERLCTSLQGRLQAESRKKSRPSKSRAGSRGPR